MNRLLFASIYITPMYLYTVILILDYMHLQTSVEGVMYVAAVMVVLTLATYVMLYGRLPQTVKDFLPMYIFFASIIIFVVRRSLPIIMDSGLELTVLALSVLLILPFMAVNQSRLYSSPKSSPTERPSGVDLVGGRYDSLLRGLFPLKSVFAGRIGHIYTFVIFSWGIFLSYSFLLLFLMMFFIMLMSMGSAFFNKSEATPFAMVVSAILFVQGALLGSIAWVVLAMVNGTPAPFTVPLFDFVTIFSELLSFAVHAFIVSIHVGLIGLVYVLKGRDLPGKVYNSFSFVVITALLFVLTFMFTRGEVSLFLHLVQLYVYMLAFFAIGRVALNVDILLTKRPLLIVIVLVCVGLGSGLVGLIPWEWYMG